MDDAAKKPLTEVRGFDQGVRSSKLCQKQRLSGGSRIVCGPRSSERRIGDKEVCQPARRDGKPDKGDAETRCADQGNGQTDRKVYHVGNKKRAHDAKPAQDAVGDTLSITVAREGQMQTVSLTLGEKNAQTQQAQKNS